MHYECSAIPEDEPVVCLLPCTPLLKPDTLRNAIKAYKRFHAATDEMLVSVCEYAHPIARAMGIEDARGRTTGTLWQLDDRADMSKSTGGMCPAYHDAGQFYIATAKRWRSGEAILSDGAKPWLLSRCEAIDIDTPEDWRMAELIYKGMEAER
jgi:N-acylneuraminate cytidylyltransferase